VRFVRISGGQESGQAKTQKQKDNHGLISRAAGKIK